MKTKRTINTFLIIIIKEKTTKNNLSCSKIFLCSALSELNYLTFINIFFRTAMLSFWLLWSPPTLQKELNVILKNIWGKFWKFFKSIQDLLNCSTKLFRYFVYDSIKLVLLWLLLLRFMSDMAHRPFVFPRQFLFLPVLSMKQASPRHNDMY